MSSVGLLRILEGGHLGFWCPACDEMHVIDERWQFNGNYYLPTFTPSYKATWRTPKGHTKQNPAPLGWEGEYEEHCCHSFVQSGRIVYQMDCTHDKAGQTLLLMPF